jgi:hypothetical protein
MPNLEYASSTGSIKFVEAAQLKVPIARGPTSLINAAKATEEIFT